jgi:uncharacterized protein HemX
MSDPSNRHGSDPARSRWVPFWVFALVLIAIGGAVFWGNSRPEKDSSQAAAVQSKADSSSPPQDDTKQAVAALQQTVKGAADQISDIQRQLKLLSEQIGALAARVDSLERARSETTGSTKKRSTPR